VGGLHTVAGYVYESSGLTVNTSYDGTYVALILNHGGNNYTYVDPDGVSFGWYVITLPDGAWEEGDRYWIVVDGTPWGDVNYTCHGHTQPDVFWWRLAGGGAEQRNVATLSELPSEPISEDEEANLKPLLALVIIIILCLHGILVAYKRPLNLTDSKLWVVDGEFQDFIVPTNQKPTTSSASNPGPSPPKPTVPSSEQPPQTTTPMTADSPAQPATTVKPYTEALNVAQAQQKADEKVKEQLNEIDTKVTELDEKFELTKYKELEVKKSAKLKKDRIYSFMILAKPCIIMEIIIAILSINFDILKVPPWDGAGLFINIIILIIGILIGLAGFKKGYKIKSKVKSPEIKAQSK
jgi:hypothetical protein